MIRPNYSKVHSWLLDSYIRSIICSDFSKVIITGDILPDNRSVLLVANHFSWWDGFFGWYVNKKIFKKKFHVMMLEKELAQRKFFSRVGAFSINQKSRGVIESLDFCSDILSNPNNFLIMFPQGKLESSHLANIKFHKGISRIVKHAPQARIIFAACLVDYYAFRRPTLTISLMEYRGSSDLHELEQCYNHHYSQSILKQDNLHTP
jgi:hypothetical protein